MTTSSSASSFTWASSSRSVTGNVRQVNEDSFLDLSAVGLWVVADGMGGHNAGDVASRAIVEELANTKPNSRPSVLIDQIDDGLCRVNRKLIEHSLATTAGGVCGSTVAALVTFGGYVACLWAGDSRVYRLRRLALEQITRDHSEVQEAADDGTPLAPEAASNVITRAVGGTANLLVDIELRELKDGDHFLICSDGLYRELSDADLAWHLRRQPEQACEAMIEQALQGQCADNVTVVSVAFKKAD